MPTFDVVSKLALHEVDNAIQQTSKEIGTRYDFRDTNSSVERNDEGIWLRSNSQSRIEAALSVLREKLARRNVSQRSLDPQKIENAALSSVRQLIKLQQGLSQEKAKEVVKFLKNSGLKVQGSIQGDSVRVSGKKKDDLQACIAALRQQDFGVELQYENFRD
jgi:uncharacterized protein YajQ (UPF0234 family)